jgi:hypothetical protein
MFPAEKWWSAIKQKSLSLDMKKIAIFVFALLAIGSASYAQQDSRAQIMADTATKTYTSVAVANS